MALLKNPWTWVVLLALALATLTVFSIHQAKIINERERTIADMTHERSLPGGIEVSGTTVGTEDDVKKAGEDAGVPMTVVEDDAHRHGSDVTGVDVVTIRTGGDHRQGLGSTGTVPRDPPASPSAPQAPAPPAVCASGDPWGYQKSGQVLRLDEPFPGGETVPYGQVTFRAWEERPWSVDVSPRVYKMATVLATDEDGKVTAYHRATVAVDGKEHVVPIASADLTETLPGPKLRWSAKLYAGLGGGVRLPAPAAEVVPSVGVSVASYGKTVLMPDWAFGVVGAGYAAVSGAPAAVLAPVLWNAGKPIPLVDNLFVGPAVSVDTHGGVAVTAGVHTKL